MAVFDVHQLWWCSFIPFLLSLIMKSTCVANTTGLTRAEHILRQAECIHRGFRIPDDNGKCKNGYGLRNSCCVPCLQCEAGTERANQTANCFPKCVPCPSGTFKTGNQAACLQCLSCQLLMRKIVKSCTPTSDTVCGQCLDGNGEYNLNCRYHIKRQELPNGRHTTSLRIAALTTDTLRLSSTVKPTTEQISIPSILLGAILSSIVALVVIVISKNHRNKKGTGQVYYHVGFEPKQQCKQKSPDDRQGVEEPCPNANEYETFEDDDNGNKTNDTNETLQSCSIKTETPINRQLSHPTCKPSISMGNLNCSNVEKEETRLKIPQHYFAEDIESLVTLHDNHLSMVQTCENRYSAPDSGDCMASRQQEDMSLTDNEDQPTSICGSISLNNVSVGSMDHSHTVMLDDILEKLIQKADDFSQAGAMLTKKERGKLIIIHSSQRMGSVMKMVHTHLTSGEWQYIDTEEADYDIVLHHDFGFGGGCKLYCAGHFKQNSCKKIGTLGCFVFVQKLNEPSIRRVAALTCRHVLLCESCKEQFASQEQSTGEKVYTVSPDENMNIIADNDGGCPTRLSDNFTYIEETGPDVGIAILNDTQHLTFEDYFFYNKQMEPLECTLSPVKPTIERRVQKCGYVSKRTTGKVTEHFEFHFKTKQRDVFCIEGENCHFSEPGDSGAIVTDIIGNATGTLAVYGIVFAGTENESPGMRKKTFALVPNKSFQMFENANIKLSFPRTTDIALPKLEKPEMERLCPERLKRIQMYSYELETQPASSIAMTIAGSFIDLHKS